MKRLTFAAACLAFVLLPISAIAEPSDTADAPIAPESVIYDADSALEFFKSLTGEWDGENTGNQHGSYPAVSFRVMAAGSAVVETVWQGQPNEMESIFHMDDGDLLLTHYCALQNAPVLRFEATEEAGLLKFVFHGGTNFDPAVDAHFHEGTFRIHDANSFESTFVVHAGGEAQPEGSSVLTRRAN